MFVAKSKLLVIRLVLFFCSSLSFINALIFTSLWWKVIFFTLQILVGGFFEAFSLCHITVVMVTTLPVSPDFLVVLMCNIAGLPLTLQKVYRKLCQRDHLTSVWDTMRSLVSTLFFLAGNIMLSLKVTFRGFAFLSYYFPNSCIK